MAVEYIDSPNAGFIKLGEGVDLSTITPQQKRNALTLINQLKQKNAFRDDSQIIDPTKNFPLP